MFIFSPYQNKRCKINNINASEAFLAESDMQKGKRVLTHK